MGTALVAYVDRQARRIELDPAVRPGARLDGHGEALLLHTTSAGHCEETADYLAQQLRRSGWTVQLRSFERLAPIANQPRTIGMLADGAAAHLLNLVGHADPTKKPLPPRTRILSGTALHQMTKRRQQCNICGHFTTGRGISSHRKNLGHDDWQAVLIEPDGTVTPAQAQAGAPEAPGEPSSASDQRANGITRLGAPEALQALAEHPSHESEASCPSTT